MSVKSSKFLIAFVKVVSSFTPQIPFTDWVVVLNTLRLSLEYVRLNIFNPKRHCYHLYVQTLAI